MVTVPVQSFVMVPVTTLQAVPVTTYHTVPATSVAAFSATGLQAFGGVQAAGAQSANASAVTDLEARLVQLLRASGQDTKASALAAGLSPCAKSQAAQDDLDKRFLELEKRLTELQKDASKVLVRHDRDLDEIKATLNKLLEAGVSQNARLKALEDKQPKAGDKEKPPVKKSTDDRIPPIPSIPLPMPEVK